MMKYFVIRNFRGTRSFFEMLNGHMLIFRNAESVHAKSVRMLKRCMVRENLGTPGLMKAQYFTPRLANLFAITGHIYCGRSLACRKNK